MGGALGSGVGDFGISGGARGRGSKGAELDVWRFWLVVWVAAVIIWEVGRISLQDAKRMKEQAEVFVPAVAPTREDRKRCTGTLFYSRIWAAPRALENAGSCNLFETKLVAGRGSFFTPKDPRLDCPNQPCVFCGVSIGVLGRRSRASRGANGGPVGSTKSDGF